MMVGNFSDINHSLRNIQEKNNIIKKCINLIQNSKSGPDTLPEYAKEDSLIKKPNREEESHSNSELYLVVERR